MEYRKFSETYYVRMDRGDEIIGSVMDLCRREQIRSAVFVGIGGCSEAEVQTYLPESGIFETQNLHGTLELVSLTGNIITDDQEELYHHTHAVLSYKDGEQHCVSAGHMKSLTVSYTAEIELRPVTGGILYRKPDPETGTGFWSFR